MTRQDRAKNRLLEHAGFNDIQVALETRHFLSNFLSLVPILTMYYFVLASHFDGLGSPSSLPQSSVPSHSYTISILPLYYCVFCVHLRSATRLRTTRPTPKRGFWQMPCWSQRTLQGARRANAKGQASSRPPIWYVLTQKKKVKVVGKVVFAQESCA